jgi:hypothetical protein
MQDKPLRTRTGQTGRDAYVYELTAIANEMRELNRRARLILTHMHDEQGDAFDASTDWHPVLTDHPASHAKDIVDYVRARDTFV